jgi:hypothetical protein
MAYRSIHQEPSGTKLHLRELILIKIYKCEGLISGDEYQQHEEYKKRSHSAMIRPYLECSRLLFIFRFSSLSTHGESFIRLIL